MRDSVETMEASAGPRQSPEPAKDGGPAKFARTALIAGALVAVVCIGLLVVIFFLDTFNATVYSVGGNDISGDTQEARDIRGLYNGARAGSIAVLVAALLVAAGAGALLYRARNSGSGEGDGGEDVDFDDLGR
jgi:ABC-type Fe3+ transport system permease subunit